MEADELSALVRSLKKRPIPLGPATVAVDYGRDAVVRLLPHREPFLFVDRVTAVDLDGRTARGVRHIHSTDPVFAGHFPGMPIYPGVLQLETMAQLGLCVGSFVRRASVDVPPDLTPDNVRALRVHSAVFLSEILPKDDITILTQLVESDGYGAVCAGQLMKGETIASLMVMEVYLVEG